MKRRRFNVPSLQNTLPGARVALPESEARHAHVLRLGAGENVELFDATGQSASAILEIDAGGAVCARIAEVAQNAAPGAPVTLAVAWPKGKRAATLVEKCSELGVHVIQPVLYERSVVSKDEESEGVARLRRIAAEAAKQSGRNDVPEILAEQPLERVLAGAAPESLKLLLDPRAETNLVDVLLENRARLRDVPLLLIVGPEGGFAPGELAQAGASGASGARCVRLAENVLRVETAALAACAVAGAFRNG